MFDLAKHSFYKRDSPENSDTWHDTITSNILLLPVASDERLEVFQIISGIMRESE